MAWKIQFSLYSCQIRAEERPLWKSQWAVSHHKSQASFLATRRERRGSCLDLATPKVLVVFSSFSPTVILHLHLFFRSWIYFHSAGCWICDNAENRANQNRSREKRWERTAVKEKNRHPFSVSPSLGLSLCWTAHYRGFDRSERYRGKESEKEEREKEMRQSETPLSITLFKACYRNPSIDIQQFFWRL